MAKTGIHRDIFILQAIVQDLEGCIVQHLLRKHLEELPNRPYKHALKQQFQFIFSNWLCLSCPYYPNPIGCMEVP